jgi:hypothetical protein
MSETEDAVPSVELPEFALHIDAAHSWFEVPYLMLAMMDLRPADFSSFSYLGIESMYLEEDLDAMKFMQRYEYLFGEKPEFNKTYDYGELAQDIRNLPRNRQSPTTLH